MSSALEINTSSPFLIHSYTHPPALGCSEIPRNSKFPAASLAGTEWNAPLLITTEEAPNHRGRQPRGQILVPPLHAERYCTSYLAFIIGQISWERESRSLRVVWRRLTGEWAQKQQQHGEGCRTGQREKLYHDTVSMETSSNPTGSWDGPSELSQLRTNG